jgi:hypothetical protein
LREWFLGPADKPGVLSIFDGWANRSDANSRQQKSKIKRKITIRKRIKSRSKRKSRIGRHAAP